MAGFNYLEPQCAVTAPTPAASTAASVYTADSLDSSSNLYIDYVLLRRTRVCSRFKYHIWHSNLVQSSKKVRNHCPSNFQLPWFCTLFWKEKINSLDNFTIRNYAIGLIFELLAKIRTFHKLPYSWNKLKFSYVQLFFIWFVISTSNMKKNVGKHNSKSIF